VRSIVIPAGDDAALVEAIERVKRGEVDVPSHRVRARRYAQGRFDRDAVYGPLRRRLLGDTVGWASECQIEDGELVESRAEGGDR